MITPEKMFSYAKKNSEYVQIYIINNSEDSLEIKNNSIDSIESADTCRVMVKVWINNREGFSISNRICLDVVDRAIKIAKASSPKEYFYGLPSKGKYVNVKTFDKKVASMSPEDLYKIAREEISFMKGSKGLSLSQSNISAARGEIRVMNSNGVDESDKETYFQVSSSMLAKLGKGISTYYDSGNEHFIFDHMKMLQNIKEKTLLFLKQEPVPQKELPVIMVPRVFSELMHNAFLSNFNAKNVEKKKSILAGKLGEKIISDSISIIDDSTEKMCINSSRFDFEGTCAKKTTIVENGIIKSFIYDHNTAKHNKMESTSNATMQGIDFSNVFFKGKADGVDEAIVVDSIIGAHTANSITTDFSVNVEKGYYLKNGKLIPLKEFMLSGKMIDALNNIIFIGKDVEQRSGVYSGSVGFSGLSVVR